MRHHLRLHRHVGPGAALLHQFAPVLHAGLGLFQERAVLMVIEPRQQRPEHAGRVADERGVDRAAQADALRVEVDLHALAPDRASGRTRCRGSSTRRSAACRSSPRRPVTAQCPAGRCRRSYRDGRRAARLCRAAASRPARRAARRSPRPRRAASSAPRPAMTTIFLPSFRIAAARAIWSSVGICALSAMRSETWSGMLRFERCVARTPSDLHVDRHGDVSDAPVGERRAAGELDDVLDVRRAHDRARCRRTRP